MWRFGFALVVTATVVLQVSSKGTECSENEWTDESSSSESNSESYEDDYYQNKCRKANEVYDLCPVICPFRTCGIDDRLVDCSPSLPRPGDPTCAEPACRCKDQTFRDDKGNCVPWEKCPTCTNPNEVYDPCDAPCPARRCDFNAEVVRCGRPPQVGDPSCIVGCRCIDGYRRDSRGVCIPANKCPKCSKPNEVYDPCDAPCPARRCDFNAEVVRCGRPPQVGDPSCIVGCRCIDGYRRDSRGVCIPANKCPKCSKPNEVYDPCDAPCPARRCDFNGAVVKCAAPPKVGDPSCLVGCRCKNGYLRDSNGVCIEEKKCPKCTKPNQVYDKCPDCSPQTCKTKNKRYKCPLIPANKSGPNCHPACRCKPGYFKNLIGDCILARDCDKCPGKHEYFSCGVACDNVCATLSEQNQTNCPIINKKCNEMCYCEEGYARAKNNTCIPIKDCKVCPAGEIYSDCPPIKCDGEYCPKDRYSPQSCPIPKKCGKGRCVCGFNSHRDRRTGKCIRTSDCPPFKCKKDNEAYNGCPSACPDANCPDYLKNVTCPNPRFKELFVVACKPSCRCQSGYYRDSQGNCVCAAQCEAKCPNPNEVYDPCDAPCPARRCDFNADVVRCAAPPKVGDPSCLVGCRCKNGYLRDSRGVCILAEKCPKCTKVNEVYDTCPDCSPQTCKTKDQVNHCPLIPACKTGPNCHPACRCKPGYFRNLLGDCILASDCDKCPGEHEFFSCGGACDNVCATLSKQNQTNCPIVNIKCNEMCYCENGYARATNNTCIPIKDCKASCNGDENAKPGCGSNCGRRCSDVGKNVTICPLYCKVNGCDCKDNYYYDANRQKCVPACDCTPTCTANEEFSNCANGLCSPQDCKDKGQQFACAPMLPGSCIPGCLCKANYLRKNGTCVPEDQCEPTPVCRDDEKLSMCANALCRAQECKKKGQPIACPTVLQCIKGCVCPEGTLRSANGLCIPENQCPVTSAQCKQYEIFSDCANGICRAQDCKDKGLTVPCPPMVQESCKAGCVCQVQHLRKNGICVPQSQCGDKPVCKINEEYSDCSNGLCRVQDCKDKGRSRPCPPMAPGSCLPGCVCPEQYLRQNGTCVPEDQCEPQQTAPQPTSPPVSNPTQPANPPVYIPSQPASPPVYIPSQPASPPVSNTQQPASPPVSNTPQPTSPPVSNPTQPANPPVYIPSQPASPPVYIPSQPASPPVSNTQQPASPPVSNTPQPTSPPVSDTPQPTNAPVCNQNQNSCGDVDSLQRSLEEASNTLAIKSLYQLDVATPGVSTIISAFSYFVLLAQLALYCNGQTYTELINVLNVTTKDDIRCAFPGLSKSVQGTQSAEIDIGNKIYVNDQYQLSDQYKEDSVVVFNAGAENINFNNPTQAANTINEWVSDATKGKITDLVSADLFNAMTRLVLANAIYFKGIWKKEFNANLTRSSDFYVNSQTTINVQMMQQKGKFNYADSSEIDAQLVELPYQNENISLVLVSPNQQDGLRNVLDKMRDTTVIYKVLSELQQETVTIFMPKFDISSKINIKEILKPIGVQAIFGSNAELSGMVVPDEALYVSDALQKATITVNEQGSEAAAASVVVVATRALPRPPQPEYIVKADHPFMYLIKSGNLILFSGYFYG